MTTEAYTLQPGTYTFIFNNGPEQIVSKEVTLTEETTITVTIESINGSMSYSISGLPDTGAYTCTCPDFTKTRASLPDSSYSSEQADADWTTSQAGADGDCKHITAVKILREEMGAVPTDVPLPVPKPSKNNPFGKWPKL